MADTNKQVHKCTRCNEEAVMKLQNLKNGKEESLCKRHLAAWVTQGQSEIMLQFAQATGSQWVGM